MPQGRRKVPFSNKQKKTQLQLKREKKRFGGDAPQHFVDCVDGDQLKSNDSSEPVGANDIVKINEQPNKRGGGTNRYVLKFFAETEDELRRRREEARKALVSLPESALEVTPETTAEMFPVELNMPKRPPWDRNMSTLELERREHKYFAEYVSKVERIHHRDGISYFDLNLETWRQLWRVLEMSDIVVVVVDIRHPIFHFSPSLYDYVTKQLDKSIVMILNKVDLVEPSLVVAWQDYLKKNYPNLRVVPFASYSGMKKKKGKKRIGKLRMTARSAKMLLEVCEEIAGHNVDLSSWKLKIEEELKQENEAGGEDGDDDDPLVTGEQLIKTLDLSHHICEKFKDGILTIGFVGQPNVGKSSVLNAIMGKKVVSVSRTPGHTKHFQTIFLTSTVRLCDCPGLVFPSQTPKPLQVLMGCYPIAQLKDPVTSIGFLSQRSNLIKILKISHPGGRNEEWSAMDVAEAWAVKRGFLTARAARPDVYRAANHLLRMALDGRTICLAFHPKDYQKMKSHWQNHANIDMIRRIQGERVDTDDFENELKSGSSDSSSDNEPESVELTTTKSKFHMLQDVDCE